jgi:hypothetical protein
MRSRNIALIILGSVVLIVALAFIGRWAMNRSSAGPDQTASSSRTASTTTVYMTPAVPDTGGNPASGSTSSTTPTVIPTSTIITQADSNKTVTLKIGTQFLLNLGGTENWTVKVGDTSIVRPVPNASAAKGTQGLFEVLRTGTTTLSAEGRPNCKAGEMCAQYIIDFKTTINGV